MKLITSVYLILILLPILGSLIPTSFGSGGSSPPPAVTQPGGDHHACLYENVNYGGNSFCVSTKGANTNVPEGFNDRARSIKVLSGKTINVCQHFDFRGACKTYTSNVPVLFSPFKATISSVRLNYGSPSAPLRGICYYSVGSYTGEWRCLSAGQKLSFNYQEPDWNNQIRSAKVYGGARVRICQNANHAEPCTLINATRANMNYWGVAYTGKITSVWVDPSIRPSSGKGICVFAHPGGLGEYQCFNSGQIVNSLRGNLNNKISSIQIFGGSTVLVCDSINLNGSCTTIVNTKSSLPSYGDIISSLHVDVPDPEQIIGPLGPMGPQGEQGVQGDTGLVGPEGPQGETGQIGPPGAPGLLGDNGDQGDRGVIGDTGPQGNQGIQGLKGDKGLQGNKGKDTYEDWLAGGNSGTRGDFISSLKGDKGNQGAQGIKGGDGPPGLQGDKGTDGTQGLQGARGVDGAPGLQGDKGDNGNQGAQGALGNQGAQGIQGNKGNQGIQGLKGDKGLQGNKGKDAYEDWLAIVGNTGTRADFMASLKGDIGDLGAQGVQGTQGDKGLQGNKGADGAQGDRGKSAYDVWAELPENFGESHSDYVASLKGNQGDQGDQGNQGSQGILGAVGPQGPQGNQGNQGTSGRSSHQVWLEQGNLGDESIFLANLKGAEGTQGAPGLKGDTGSTGTDILSALNCAEDEVPHRKGGVWQCIEIGQMGLLSQKNRKLSVNNRVVTEKLKIGDYDIACTAEIAGQIRFSGTHFEGCNATEWRILERSIITIEDVQNVNLTETFLLCHKGQVSTTEAQVEMTIAALADKHLKFFGQSPHIGDYFGECDGRSLNP